MKVDILIGHLYVAAPQAENLASWVGEVVRVKRELISVQGCMYRVELMEDTGRTCDLYYSELR